MRLTCSPFDKRRLSSLQEAFLSIAQKVGARNVMMNADLGTAQTAEIFFRRIGAGAVKAVGLAGNGEILFAARNRSVAASASAVPTLWRLRHNTAYFRPNVSAMVFRTAHRLLLGAGVAI
jgi:hypothetical protein